MVTLSSLLSAVAAGSAVALQLTSAMPTDHDVARMFRRQSPSEVGSADWKARYPPAGTIPKAKQEWLNALAEVERQGKIPDIPAATMVEGIPSYPDGVSPADPSRCHRTFGCDNAEYDLVNGPDGHIGISFDDGPLPPGRALNDFLKENRIPNTLFHIGSNVVKNTDIALQARENPLTTFGAHTWTHGYSSSQSNEELVGELGWSMQVLADVNGGRIPAFWRPPFGDVDNRVRAIAREVFGLHTIIWTSDSQDWTFGTDGQLAEIQATVQAVIDGPKAPGQMILQHELYDGCVTVFKNTYPSMIQNGWTVTDIPGLWGFNSYKNAVGPQTDVIAGIDIANTTAVDLRGAWHKRSDDAPPPGTTSLVTAQPSPTATVSLVGRRS